MRGHEHIGGWTPGGNPGSICPAVWEELVRIHRVRSMVDVGCGQGWSMLWFKQRRIKVLGVEGDPEAVKSSPVKAFVHRHDYTSGPFRIRPMRDLCWCAEFVEHVEERFISNFAETFRCCRVVALTHALPGQGGHHHVNERDDGYWQRILSQHGLRYEEGESIILRRLADHGSYAARSLMVFINEDLS